MLLDLSGPLEVLSNAGEISGKPYDLRVASVTGGLVRSTCDLEVATVPLKIEATDTFIVVGAGAAGRGLGERDRECRSRRIRAGPPHRERLYGCFPAGGKRTPGRPRRDDPLVLRAEADITLACPPPFTSDQYHLRHWTAALLSRSCCTDQIVERENTYSFVRGNLGFTN